MHSNVDMTKMIPISDSLNYVNEQPLSHAEVHDPYLLLAYTPSPEKKNQTSFQMAYIS